MLPSLWENRRLVGQCMWGSHFWLFICYYSYLQANTYEELPEQVIGAARLAHVEPSTAVVPNLENNSESNKDNSSNDATSSEDDSSKKTNWFSLFLFFEEFDEIFLFFILSSSAIIVLNHCTNLRSGWSLRAPILSSGLQTCSFILFHCSSFLFFASVCECDSICAGDKHHRLTLPYYLVKVNTSTV